MRAAVYCRISQDKTGEALGVARQLEDCQALAERLGWSIVDVYTDNDVSAASGKPRPAYRRMLADVEAGRVDALLAWAPDRLYRRLADLEELIPLVEAHGVQISTCRAGDFDLATPLGKMIARILGAVATGENDVKVDRFKRAVRQHREAGRMPGSGPRMKGWTREGVLIPGEAAEIQWMAEQVLQGRSLKGLAEECHRRGIRSTLGNPIGTRSLHRLLTNPRLAGHAVLKGEIVGVGSWPPVLEPETWETVRAVLTASPPREQPPRVSTLVKLIYCGGCGKRMVTGSRTMKGGGLSRTYRCTREPGEDSCQGVSIAAHPVEETVEGYARAKLDDPRVREALGHGRQAPRMELAELTALQARLVELEQQLDEPGVPVAAIVRAMDRAQARIEQLSAAVSVAPVVSLPPVGAVWPTDVPTRLGLVRLVVESVKINPATVFGFVDLDRIVIEPKALAGSPVTT